MLLLAGTAQADFITLEPDDYAPGANVSNVIPGITMSAVQGTQEPGEAPVWGTTAPVYSVEVGVGHAATGSRVFGATPTEATPWENPDPEHALHGPALRADFNVTGVTSVEFRWSDVECPASGACEDMAVMRVFDASDHLLATCGWFVPAPSAGCSDTPLGLVGTNTAAFSTTYSNLSGNIAYAIIGSLVQVDRVTVSVPEPGTLALFGASLLAIGLRRRRVSGTT
jgi:hypothetical protein